MNAERRPNVLLIVLDTTRAETLYSMLDKGELAGVKKYSDISTNYPLAFSTSPWTLPSHASLFTGQRSSDHQTHAGNKRFSPDHSPLAEILSNDGYTTLGISGNNWISGEFGFDRGFDNLSMKWDRYWSAVDLSSVSRANGLDRYFELIKKLSNKQAAISLINAIYAKFLSNRNDLGARQTTTRTIKWLNGASSEQPFFYFINYFEPHLPYRPPNRFRELYDVPSDVEVNQDPWEYVAGELEMDENDFDLLEKLYKAEISYLDTHLDRLFESLRDNNLIDDTMVVIVGDHGENIGHHHLMDHQYSLHDSLLHVPLLIHYPEQHSSKTHLDLVEVRDIFPTIAHVCGVDIPNNQSISSNNLLEDGRSAVFAEYRHPQPDMDALEQSVSNLSSNYTDLDQTLRSVRTTQWKLIERENGEIQLFEAGHEDVEVSQNNPNTVEELRQLMDDNHIKLQRGNKTSVEISAQNRKRLEDLGYI